jgi:hypothetical protein
MFQTASGLNIYLSRAKHSVINATFKQDILSHIGGIYICALAFLIPYFICGTGAGQTGSNLHPGYRIANGNLVDH